MLIQGEDLEWEDGTPVLGIIRWEGDARRRLVYVGTVNGADPEADRDGRPSGYYDASTGGYAGSEAMFQKLRNVAPRGPEEYEEWFK